jgi:hypothetical protein
MSAASPAGSQVRHSAAHASHAPSPQAARPAPMHKFVSADVDDDLKLHLNDIPRSKESLEVEGFKPSLLSRLLEFVAPLNKR